MKKRKHSVRTKLILLSIAAVFGTVALCILLNEFFLVRFYERSKQKMLGDAFSKIDKRISEDQAAGKTRDVSEPVLSKGTSISEELCLELDILCTKSGITAVIVDDIFSDSSTQSQTITSYYYFGAGGKNNQEELVTRKMIGEYLYPGYNQDIINKETKLITDRYRIHTMYDLRMQSKYIELAGTLSSGKILLMRSNVESMQESVGVANRFLVYVGLGSAFLISVIMVFVSRRFSKPLQQLSKMAVKMADLNFDVKYPIHSNDEVGELGESINELSGKLEATISKLKSANNELLLDIRKKTEAEEVRQEFLSNVTHELKTPIALIQGYAEGLKDNISENAEDREFYCDVIIDEAAKMNSMVKKLLTLNHLEAGTTQVELSRFDLTELISSVISSTDILVKQKEVTITFLQKEPVFVWGDEYMIEEVLTNYISNAFNHVGGQKKILVSLSFQEKTVRVSVFNTGCPIPEEDIGRIWEKFYKVDKARTREYGGNGIGLSIVKAIMEAHNQAFGVQNHEDGVEFWFELDSRAEGGEQ